MLFSLQHGFSPNLKGLDALAPLNAWAKIGFVVRAANDKAVQLLN